MPTTEISIDDLPLATPFALEAQGMKMVIVRTSERIYAFEDVCPHAFWPLSEGTFHDGVLECPGHAWEFQIQTGKCLESPAYCLTPIATTVVGSLLRIEWEATKNSSFACIHETPLPGARGSSDSAD